MLSGRVGDAPEALMGFEATIGDFRRFEIPSGDVKSRGRA